MKSSVLNRLLHEERGVLTVEWILLVTIFIIGIVSGVAAFRDTLVLRYYYGSNAIGAANTGYTIYEYKGRNGQYVAEGSYCSDNYRVKVEMDSVEE